jgi:tripartite-type tricarboxylate transporter receptor subunit TctC
MGEQRRRFIRGMAAAAGLLSFAATVAHAQSFPARAIHILLPIAPGGLLDGTVRTIAQPMSDSIDQPVLVENRPGGSTSIGMQACARSAPDGYTVCITTPDSLSYQPYLFTKLPYDPEHDFAPVTNLVIIDNVIVANPAAPFSSFKELIAYAKVNPGKVNWGTWGPGSLPDVYLQAVKQTLAIDITAVPYKGGAQAFPAILAGEVQVTFGAIGVTLAHIKAGRLKALAATPQASPLLPGIPTLKGEGVEPGLPSYFGVFAPANTPAPILDRLAAEFAKALAQPKVQEFLHAQVLEAVGSTPAEFAAFVKADRMNAERVFNAMGIKPTDVR